jgi:hypothetical protein
MNSPKTPGQTAYETVAAQFSPHELHDLATHKPEFSALTPEQRGKWDVIAAYVASATRPTASREGGDETQGIGITFPPPPPPPPTKATDETADSAKTKR